MDPAVFGYARVSQAEGENGLATQRRILNAHGLRDDRIFADIASGRHGSNGAAVIVGGPFLDLLLELPPCLPLVHQELLHTVLGVHIQVDAAGGEDRPGVNCLGVGGVQGHRPAGE